MDVSCFTSKFCLLWVFFFTISGHCVEFNVPGGVIQDQRSASCKTPFPKCDSIYNSTDAYKCKTKKKNIFITFVLNDNYFFNKVTFCLLKNDVTCNVELKKKIEF